MTLRRALRSLLLGAALASTLSGCSGSLESLGTDALGNGGGAGNGAGSPSSAGAPTSLQPVTHAGGYYNAFETLLNKSSTEINNKISAGFQQLFYGGSGQFIYYKAQTADDRSLIYDALHKDVRTEGIGLAMLITVELDHREEFDDLWRYAKANLLETSGPAKGYYSSFCGEDEASPCFDVYGMQHFALALMLANGRWHSTADMPYASDALALLDVMQNKEAENGGILMGIGNAFDAQQALVREEPSFANAGYTTRSSLQMPAAYWYWAKATGNPFWNTAVDASHAFLLKAADPTTGLSPMRNYFDGTPVDDSPGYTEQGYRTQLNLALDALWGTASADQADLANRLLNFFYSQDIAKYGGSFDTDGTPKETNRAQALISVNGALTVAAATNEHRAAFAQAVWDQAIPTGDNRYYEGLLYLMSMLVLSGQLQVY